MAQSIFNAESKMHCIARYQSNRAAGHHGYSSVESSSVSSRPPASTRAHARGALTADENEEQEEDDEDLGREYQIDMSKLTLD
jgi:hypothetical protein